VALFFSEFSFAQVPNVEDVRVRALAFTTRIETQPAAKFHGILEGKTSESEVWIEIRGESIFCERISVSGESKAERGENRRESERMRKIGGVSSKAIDSFEKNIVYTYLPHALQARIEEKPFIQFDNVIQGILPKNWTCFNNSYREPFMRFSYLLGKDTKGVRVTWDDVEKIVRFTHNSDVAESIPNRGFASRFIEVDPVSFAVVRYGMSGGVISEQGQLRWKQDGGQWYVEEGSVSVDQKIRSKWTISEYSADAKSLRSSFALTESNLPFGTRITHERIGKPRSTSFVGGERGKIEHDLRVAAIRFENRK
jgi:hypothetical protein